MEIYFPWDKRSISTIMKSSTLLLTIYRSHLRVEVPRLKLDFRLFSAGRPWKSSRQRMYLCYIQSVASLARIFHQSFSDTAIPRLRAPHQTLPDENTCFKLNTTMLWKQFPDYLEQNFFIAIRFLLRLALRSWSVLFRRLHKFCMKV